MSLHFREGILSWSELIEIVDSEAFFQNCNLVHCHVESIAAECLLFDLVKLFAQSIVFMFTDDLVERREEHGIFARFVRPVHAYEAGERVAGGYEIIALYGSLNPFGQRTSGGVLRHARSGQA